MVRPIGEISAFQRQVEAYQKIHWVMDTRQKILKAVYPLWNIIARLTGRHQMNAVNEKKISPRVGFYGLTFSTVNNPAVSMKSFEGKKVLIVNTASECVYTTQYDGLQELYEKYNDRLVVVGFPSNEFKQQEKGSDEEIGRFCSMHFGVKFPVAKKAVVRKGKEQHPVFKWLTDANQNGWNSRQPVWNFSKYLVDENGNLTHVFGPPVSPMSPEILEAVSN
jgi:glutathione peroxidase